MIARTTDFVVLQRSGTYLIELKRYRRSPTFRRLNRWLVRSFKPGADPELWCRQTVDGLPYYWRFRIGQRQWAWGQREAPGETLLSYREEEA